MSPGRLSLTKKERKKQIAIKKVNKGPCFITNELFFFPSQIFVVAHKVVDWSIDFIYLFGAFRLPQVIKACIHAVFHIANLIVDNEFKKDTQLYWFP